MGTKRRSIYQIVGNEVFIRSTQGHVAVVDLADMPLVDGFAWQSSATKATAYFYRRYRSGGKHVLEQLHRRLTNAPNGMDVDHIDGDGLNNRRSNLRVCTHAQNCANKKPPASGRVGVYFDGKRYYSKIKINGKPKNLGRFDTADEAEAAYRAARYIPEEFYSRSQERF